MPFDQLPELNVAYLQVVGYGNRSVWRSSQQIQSDTAALTANENIPSNHVSFQELQEQCPQCR